MGMVFSTMPPVVPLSGFGLVCFLTMFTPSTTRCESSLRSDTTPRLPLSRPANTMTWSPLRILFMALLSLQNFGSQRNDLHELFGAQLARHRSEDAGADRLQLGVEQHCCVAVELDERTVGATDALGGTDHHCTVDLALLDATTWSGFLDADLDDVAHAGITPLGATEHLDTQDGFRARVVGHFEPGFSLDHFLIFPTCTNEPPGGRHRGQSWARRRHLEPLEALPLWA